MQKFPTECLKELAKYTNCPIYVVGGAVRNFLLGIDSDCTDIDICGSFDISILKDRPDITINSINKRLGTCQIKMGGAVFEYTRFRSEHYEGGLHVPSNIEFHNSIELDTKRRDFTINSIYYDVLNDKIIDLLGGESDLKSKTIRIADSNTFKSDGLRIMRAVRFAAELGFCLDESSEDLLVSSNQLLMDISPDRKRDELEKILHADEKYGVEYAQYNGLKLMQKYRLFPYVIREIQDLEGVKQNPKYHLFDVLEHTFLAVKYARRDIRLAALMHDTGKPACLDSEGHMKGHNVVSEKIARVALGKGRLNYSNKIIEETARLCFLHMYDLKGEVTDAKMKYFVVDNIDIIDKIAALREADGKATGMATNQKFNRFLDFKNQLINEGAPLSVKDLKLDGSMLEELGVAPSERGRVLKELLYTCILTPRLNNVDWLASMAIKIAKAPK